MEQGEGEEKTPTKPGRENIKKKKSTITKGIKF